MKTRTHIVMLVLGCLLVMLVYTAQKTATEALAAPGSVGQATTQKPTLLKTETDKISYVIGAQFGQSFKKQGIKISVQPLMQGLKDAMAGKKLALSGGEIKKVMTSFQQRMAAKRAAQAAKNLADGNAFLEANKAKEGVKVLPSGLQYKVIKEGTGKPPGLDDKVRTHYRGTLINGTEFDSSYKRGKPTEFAVKQVIKGWIEALQLMKEGAKWELYVPANLAYGERGRQGIPPNSTLIFEMELLEVLQ